MESSCCLQTTFDDECTTLSSKITVYGELQPLIRAFCMLNSIPDFCKMLQ